MKHTGRYFELNGSVEPPTGLPVLPDEKLIGWYRNPEPWQDSLIVFTDGAIYGAEGGNVTRIPLSEITGYEFPKSKANPTGVRVRTRDGFRFLRAAGSFGSHGNQKDAFSLIMVILTLARAASR